jgi:Tol biopolymer transport system component
VTSSPSGRYRVFVTSAETLVIDQSTDRALPLANYIRDVRFNRDESQIAFRLANDPWPQDVFLSDLDGAHIRRLIHSDAARD